jgi:hypothetical protein
MAQEETKPLPWVLPALLVFAASFFLPGIQWGLPSRSADPYLFGNRTPWTGQQILALAPDWGQDTNRAADVAAHPLANRDQPILLNQTDAQCAAIVRRYRLYSDQPDEMITLRALAQMKPAKLQFDPKLYQYGGLWIYPIGALFKIASLFRLVRVTPDLAFYLEHPEAFGRLYVLMRLYSAAWGLVGVAVMYHLAQRISQSQIIGATAAVCYMLLPTVINGAHEAKPHLAGAVLGLIAVDMAIRAIESGHWRSVIATGIACGAAASMVLSGWLMIGILPVMGIFAARSNGLSSTAHLAPPGRAGILPPTKQPIPALPGWAKSALMQIVAKIAASCAIATLTYAVCNPYVILHLLGDRTVLQSNIENSVAMYQAPASVDGALHGILLLAEGGSTTIFFGMLAIGFFAWRKEPIAWLLAAAALPGLCVFLMHATGKPGEYARFALSFDLSLIVGMVLGISVLKRTVERVVMGCVLVLMLLPFGISYVLDYERETFVGSTRLIVAERLADLSSGGTLAVDAEPAPYSLPPVDLFRWKMVLLPRGMAAPVDADVRVDPVDAAGVDSANVAYLNRPVLLPTPISWAGKPFRIQTPPDDASAAKGRP